MSMAPRKTIRMPCPFSVQTFGRIGSEISTLVFMSQAESWALPWTQALKYSAPGAAPTISAHCPFLLAAAMALANLEYPLFPELDYDSFESIVLRNAGNDWMASNMRDVMATSSNGWKWLGDSGLSSRCGLPERRVLGLLQYS